MVITWTDAYKIGIPMIDNDHQALIEMLNALHDAEENGADGEEAGRLLDKLIEQLAAHCRREETLLDRSDYPDRLAHAGRHPDMLVRLGLLAQQYRKEAAGPSGKKAEQLSALLLIHIAEDDPPFKNFLKTLV